MNENKKKQFSPIFVWGRSVDNITIPLTVCGGFFWALNMLVNIKVQKNH